MQSSYILFETSFKFILGNIKVKKWCKIKMYNSEQNNVGEGYPYHTAVSKVAKHKYESN